MSEVESVMTTAQYSLEPEELARTALAVGPYLASNATELGLARYSSARRFMNARSV
jgi:hypothetical protein